MSNLRDLLIDIRMELRKLVQDFHRTELCARIDAAVSALGRLPDSTLGGLSKAAAAATGTTVATSDTQLSDRIARAWQAAAADLKQSDPALFEALHKRVVARLGSTIVIDPAPALQTPTRGEPDRTPQQPGVAAASKAAAVVKIAVVDPESIVPSVETLGAVAAGTRQLTAGQREWCMGEAMVLSGFARSPEELIAQGDSELARIVLAAKNA